eukprot:TRINITY_DN943_c1_g1_i3.p1 TRINITY_DN943_c1_g1~~TRINITY_DN943_c1_g1_i3.p1  ORF type:complete len:609 (-),score=160.11 TRINITY_DN943_c1_g1_i3:10-1836(-)
MPVLPLLHQMTDDVFDTVAFINDKVWQYDFGHDTSIFYTRFKGSVNTDYYHSELYKVAPDNWNNSTKIDTNVAGLLAVDDVLFYVTMEGASNKLQLWASRGLGSSSFLPASFPSDLALSKFTIIEVSLGSVFMHVTHDLSDRGNIYVSGDHFRFSLALEGNSINPTTGAIELTKFTGINGVYIANVYDDNDDIITMVSYDNGAEWMPISGSVTDSHNNLLPCNSNATCQLNLHLTRKLLNPEEVWGPIHSRQSALGLTLASGNYGASLLNKEDEAQTFFSRNAGKTWTQIANQTLTYEITDHGGFILSAYNTPATSSAWYTWNEALTMLPCSFTNNGDVHVNLIYSGPSFNSQSFVMFAQRGTKTVMFHWDFSSLHEQACTENQYETWSVTDAVGGKCILGQEIVVKRRIQTAECYNPSIFEQVSYLQGGCPCASEDYECDYCFEAHASSKGQCTLAPECDMLMNVTAPPEDCDGSYNISRGYRLVSGTQCTVNGGLNLLPLSHACPSPSSSDDGNKGRGALIAAIVILGVIALVVLGFFILRDEKSRKWIQDKVSWGKYAPLKGSTGIGSSNNEFVFEDDNNVVDVEEDAPELSDSSIVKITEQDSK